MQYGSNVLLALLLLISGWWLVSAHADSSINLLVRLWCNSEDNWPVYFNTIEAVKLAFDKEGITIPFPQRDVHFFPQQQ